MRCNNCNVEIACKTNICPLCHKKLSSNTNEEIPFPKANVKKLRLPLYKKIYIIIALIATIACAIVNSVFNPKFLWSLTVPIGFIYLYYLISVTILTQHGFHKRILGQAVMLSVIFILIRLIVGGNHWMFIVWLPAVYVVSDILMCIFIAKKGKESPKYIMTLLLLCIFGILPIVCAFIFNLKVKAVAIAVSSFNVLLFILTCIIWHKTLLHEMKKVFHI